MTERIHCCKAMDAFNLSFISVLLFTIIGQYEAREPTKSVYFLSASIGFNRSHMTHYVMSIRQDKRVADIFVGATKTIYLDPFISISLAPITRKKSNGFLTPWLRKLWLQSTLPQSCPIPEGNYSWIGLSMEKLYIPPVIPASKYSIITYGYFPRNNLREMIGNLSLIVEVK